MLSILGAAVRLLPPIESAGFNRTLTFATMDGIIPVRVDLGEMLVWMECVVAEQGDAAMVEGRLRVGA
jgi:hypothetical protein